MLKAMSSGLLILSLLSLSSCGFELRGRTATPQRYAHLNLSPNTPYDPFQRVLRQSIKGNGIQYTSHDAPVLSILKYEFSEQPIAYGSDGQVNLSFLKLKVTYELLSPSGSTLVEPSTVEVERDFTQQPNAVLGTDFERQRLQNDLYQDAASQIIRQLVYSTNDNLEKT